MTSSTSNTDTDDAIKAEGHFGMCMQCMQFILIRRMSSISSLLVGGVKCLTYQFGLIVITPGLFVADDADLWNETLALDVLESAVTDVEQVHTGHANVHDNHGEFIPQWTRLCQPQDCQSTVHPCKIPPGANLELLALTIVGDCCTS